jgi:ABC-2 type transport system ATP-binding protein
MGSVEELCDHITLINKSKNILNGPINEVRQKYGNNVFELTFRGDLQNLKNSLDSNYTLISDCENAGLKTAQIKVNNYSSDNRLLSMVLPAVEVTGFNQLIPSMNDIFIKVVETYNHANGVTAN